MFLRKPISIFAGPLIPESKDAGQARRLLALAAAYDGGTRTEAAKIGGVTVQIVRDWVVKFNASGPNGLIDRKAPGPPPRLNDAHRTALVAMIEAGPIPAVHGVVRWRIVDLCQWIWEKFRISVSKQTLSRELRAMDYRRLQLDHATMLRPLAPLMILKKFPCRFGPDRA